MRTQLLNLLARLRDDQRGMTTVEYTIVLCLIAAISVTVWQSFGSELTGHLDGATRGINGALAGEGGN